MSVICAGITGRFLRGIKDTALSKDEFKTLFNQMENKIVNPALKDAIRGRKVAIAFSGGPDSLALLALARKALSKDGIIAFYVNHGMNSRGVGEDDDLVLETFKRLDVQGEVLKLKWDQSRLETLSKGQLQEALRTERYKLLLDACKRNGSLMMLTGHNLDDDVGTMIYRMCRASGIDGLAGMKSIVPFHTASPWSAMYFLGHPLLSIPKGRLLKTCEELGLEYNFDKSNLDEDFNRNLILSSLIKLQESTNVRLEDLEAAQKFFKEFRYDLHMGVEEAMVKSTMINRHQGDATVILNDASWLHNPPIASRVIRNLAQFASCQEYPGKTKSIQTVLNHLIASYEDYLEREVKILRQFQKSHRHRNITLLPYDKTKRIASMKQIVAAGACFLPLARNDALKRIENANRNSKRELDAAPCVLVQRTSPGRINHQLTGAFAKTVTLAPGEFYLWDDRFYLSYAIPKGSLDSKEENPNRAREFSISHMTVADVRELEHLTGRDASHLRKFVYGYMGQTPGSHLYNLPVIREPATGYLAFPTLSTDVPMRNYLWSFTFAGNNFLSGRINFSP